MKRFLFSGCILLVALLSCSRITTIISTEKPEFSTDIIPVGTLASFTPSFIYYDTRSGVKVSPSPYVYADYFSDGVALVADGDGFYYIDKDFKAVNNIRYATATRFNGGAAVVAREKEAIQVIGIDGTVLATLKDVIKASRFHDGVSCIVNDKNQYGLVDTKGNIVVEPQYSDLSIPEYGFLSAARFVDGVKKFGIIDPDGNTVIPFEYNEILQIHPKGLFVVVQDHAVHILDSKGEQVLGPLDRKSNPTIVSDKLIRYEEDNNGKTYYGLASLKGKRVTPADFLYIGPFSKDGLAAARADSGTESWGAINPSGKWVIDPDYASVVTFSTNGLLGITDKEDGVGLMGKDGAWISRPRYSELCNLDTDKFLLKLDDAIQCVSADGTRLFNVYDAFMVRPADQVVDYIESQIVDIDAIVDFISSQIEELNLPNLSITAFKEKYGVSMEKGREVIDVAKVNHVSAESWIEVTSTTSLSFYDGYVTSVRLPRFGATFTLDDKIKDSIPDIVSALRDRYPGSSGNQLKLENLRNCKCELSVGDKLIITFTPDKPLTK